MARYQTGGWSHGLFGCFGDVTLCITAYFLPCVVHGRNAESTQAGECLPCGVASMIPGMHLYALSYVRGVVRDMKGIDGTVLNDVILSLCCPMCVIVQTAQEIQDGLSPSAQSMCRE